MLICLMWKTIDMGSHEKKMSVIFCYLPLDSSSLLLLLEPDILKLQWAGDEADLTAFFH